MSGSAAEFKYTDSEEAGEVDMVPGVIITCSRDLPTPFT